MRNEFNKLLTKPMDRKMFLRYMGGTLLAVTGITGLLSALLHTESQSTARGYGSNPYGR